jgi:hypothetical protein
VALFVGNQSGFYSSLNERIVHIAQKHLGMSKQEIEERELHKVNPLDGFNVRVLSRPPLTTVTHACSVFERQLLANRMGGEEKLVAALRDLLRTDEISLSNALCACLPASEVITTSQDQNFEDASLDVDLPTAVLPHEVSLF